MRLLYHHRRLRLHLLSSHVRPMSTGSLLHFTAFSKPATFSSQRDLLHSQMLLFCLKPSSSIRPLSLRTNVFVEDNAEEEMLSTHFKILKMKLQELGIDADLCGPGQYYRLLCPNCQGGDTEERSLSLFITQDGGSALWMCFRAKCGWKGSTKAVAGGQSLMNIPKTKKKRELSESELMLERLCDELIAYFAERLISKETLLRNGFKQRMFSNQIVMAFQYHRRGDLVSCKV